MSEMVTAEQIEALQTDGFVVVDDLLTDAELDTFEPLVTAAVAYRSAGDERTLEEPQTNGPVDSRYVDHRSVWSLRIANRAVGGSIPFAAPAVG